jgi:hypothetical protein
MIGKIRESKYRYTLHLVGVGQQRSINSESRGLVAKECRKIAYSICTFGDVSLDIVSACKLSVAKCASS